MSENSSMSDEAVEDAARSVAEAWNNPGPVPEYHRVMQLKLRKEWPALAEAVEALAAITPNPYRSQA